MAVHDLKTKMADALKPGERQRNPGDRALTEFAETLEGLLGNRRHLQVLLEPGYQTNLGLQMNVLLLIPSRAFRDVFFRAYVPPAGFPVALDLFGEEPVLCPDESKLEEELLNFLKTPQVRIKLEELKRFATTAP